MESKKIEVELTNFDADLLQQIAEDFGYTPEEVVERMLGITEMYLNGVRGGAHIGRADDPDDLDREFIEFFPEEDDTLDWEESDGVTSSDYEASVVNTEDDRATWVVEYDEAPDALVSKHDGFEGGGTLRSVRESGGRIHDDAVVALIGHNSFTIVPETSHLAALKKVGFDHVNINVPVLRKD